MQNISTNIFVSAISSRLRRSDNISTTSTPAEDDDDDFDEDESGEEIDDDGKVYKNPRNSPSTLCPRDEEQATLLVCLFNDKYQLTKYLS